jgi:8-oxo-(d)GTP phosphatase
VLWRPGPAGTAEVAVIHRPRYDDWSLPKGKLEPGEHVLAAATREIAEETGQQVKLGRPLKTQHYEAFGRPKEVRYWAARALGGEFTPTEEVDRLEWLSVDDALKRLTRLLDAEVVAAFAEGPANTATLVVLRHTATVPRSEWDGPDVERPCSERGRAQARALVPLLGAYGVRNLLSSDARRCVQSLEPYAAAAGVGIATRRGLSEETGAKKAAAVRAEILAVVNENTDLLVCTHRPALPPLFEALAEATGAPMPSSPLRKAEFVVAHICAGRALATERHRP